MDNSGSIGVDVGPHRTVGVVSRGGMLVERRECASGSGALARVVTELGAAVDLQELSHVTVSSNLVEDLLEARELRGVGVIRLCRPTRTELPPFHGWPADLAALVGAPGHLAETPEEIGDRILDDLRTRALQSVAITAFSSEDSVSAERRASTVLRTALPGVGVTLSHSLGPVGLLRRENATILNAAILGAVRERLTEWQVELTEAGASELPLHLVRYDGTVADADFVRQHPFALLGGRRAARIRGSAELAGLDHGQVVEVRDDGQGFEVITVVDRHPQRSDRGRTVLGVATSLPRLDVRWAAPGQRWDRIAGDDHVLAREARIATGESLPLLLPGPARVVLPAGRERRRLHLVDHDQQTLQAVGAAVGVVGAECERLVADEHGADEVRREARVRAVAAGARIDATRILEEVHSPVSYLGTDRTAVGAGSLRVLVRVVGTPCGRYRPSTSGRTSRIPTRASTPDGDVARWS